MSDSTIIKTIFINADAETVWAFLTDKDKLAEWFYRAESDLVQDRDYTLMGTTDDGSEVRKCWGKVLESNRPSKLVYTFTIGPLGDATTTVTWNLDEAHGGTRLTLTHEGIGEAAGAAALQLLLGLDSGWDQHLGDLREAATRSA